VIQEAEGETIEAMLGEGNSKKVSKEMEIKGERGKRRRRRSRGREKEGVETPSSSHGRSNWRRRFRREKRGFQKCRYLIPLGLALDKIGRCGIKER